jgi:hypothetical protein
MTVPILTDPDTADDAEPDDTIRTHFGAHFDRLAAVLRGEATAAPDGAGPPPLDLLTGLFGLSRFERDLLLLCVGAELHGPLTQCIADVGGDPAGLPTFGLALERLPGAHWDALSARRPLRFWQLISIGAAPRLTDAPLNVDEAVLMYITGVDTLDPSLDGLVRLTAPRTHPLPPSQCELAAQAAAFLDAGHHVCLIGADAADRRLVAEHIAAQRGQHLSRTVHGCLPAAAADRAAVHRRLARAALLTGALILIEADADNPHERARLAQLPDDLLIPTVISGIAITAPGVTTRRVSLPDGTEQEPLWAAVLQPSADEFGDQLPQLASAFRVGVPLAESVAADVAVAEPTQRHTVLWESTRDRLRAGLDDLADRIHPSSSWEDLVLPAESAALLAELVAHARHRDLIGQSWPGQRGHGVTAMFTGDSGTGKTMAAEVVAGELGLDLYRIDLARVVDKYIGETEKNLSRIFDAADASGALLLFDEADALFGKRGEVKDAHDRYANLEVAHLLTRMECYRGVAVLTTNLSGTIDRAFVRRLRFIVPFPFPDPHTRRQLWQRAFPASIPVAELDLDRLAQLPIAGGTIRTIAVGAAIAAAHAGVPVTFDQVLTVARRELTKVGKNPGIAASGGTR